MLERKCFEYQEMKPSNKLAHAIYPEWHCVALSIVDRFHLTRFFQTGVYESSIIIIMSGLTRVLMSLLYIYKVNKTKINKGSIDDGKNVPKLNKANCNFWEQSSTRKTSLKLWIYEIHILELRNEEINVKKILAVIGVRAGLSRPRENTPSKSRAGLSRP